MECGTNDGWGPETVEAGWALHLPQTCGTYYGKVV